MLQGLLHPLHAPMRPKRPSSSSSAASTAGDPHPHPHKKLLRDPTITPPSSSSPETASLQLLRLLLHCAELVSAGDLDSALDLIPEIDSLSSPFGSSPQRVAAYFADALRSRILSSTLCLPASPLPPRAMALVRHHHRVSQAFQAYNSISPLVKFSHFTANQAIFQALESESHVHIVDLDIMQGLQWPGLFQILSSRSPSRIQSLRITGFGCDLEMLEATGRRLSDFAAVVGLAFDFVPIEGRIGDLVDSDFLKARHSGEVTVVHWLQHCLYDVTGSDIGTSHLLQTLRPKLVTVVEQDLGSGTGFLGRFVEALHYYSALFDALGESDGGDVGEGGSVERHVVERQVLGCEIRNIVAAGGPRRRWGVGGGADGRVERWGEEMRRAGFRNVSLAGSPAAQAALLLGMYPWKGYTLLEEGGCLKLGWKDLSLLTASAWEPSGPAPSVLLPPSPAEDDSYACGIEGLR